MEKKLIPCIVVQDLYIILYCGDMVAAQRGYQGQIVL